MKKKVTIEKIIAVGDETIKLKRGDDGRWRQTSLSRKWNRAKGTYNLTVQLETFSSEYKILQYDVAKNLKNIFKDTMLHHAGDLVNFFTNNNDKVIMDIEVPLSKSPSEIVSVLKSKSSRLIKLDQNIAKICKKHCEDRPGDTYGKMFWGGGYKVISNNFPKTLIDTFIKIDDEE